MGRHKAECDCAWHTRIMQHRTLKLYPALGRFGSFRIGLSLMFAVCIYKGPSGIHLGVPISVRAREGGPPAAARGNGRFLCVH